MQSHGDLRERNGGPEPAQANDPISRTVNLVGGEAGLRGQGSH